jgi:hypothetical protein
MLSGNLPEAITPSRARGWGGTKGTKKKKLADGEIILDVVRY